MTPALAVIRGGGSALVLAHDGHGLPRVLHWGADLPDAAAADLSSSLGRPGAAQRARRAVAAHRAPDPGEGWLGHPRVCRAPRAVSTTAPRGCAPSRAVTGPRRARDGIRRGCRGRARYRLDEHGVLVVESSADQHLRRRRRRPSTSPRCAPLLPLPARADELLDLTGRWCRERSPQRRPLAVGTRLRAGATRSHRPRRDPAAGRRHRRLRLPDAARCGRCTSRGAATTSTSPSGCPRAPASTPRCSAAASCCARARCASAPGETLRRARRCCSCTRTDGLDGVSRAGSHRHLRARAGHPHARRARSCSTPGRPSTSTTTSTGCSALADARRRGRRRAVRARRRLVRRPARRPRGPRRLVSTTTCGPTGSARWSTTCTGLGHAVRAVVRARDGQPRLRPRPRPPRLGARAARRAPPPPSRAPARARPRQPRGLRARARATRAPLVGEYDIDFIKWDHNRDLHEAVRTGATAADRPAVHAQTLARLRACSTSCARGTPSSRSSRAPAAAPGSTSASSTRTDRVWASDCNDALERPADPALDRAARAAGADRARTSGPPRAHTTHRDLDLSFRLLVALVRPRRARVGHHRRCTPDELDELAAWSALYRELRPLLHGGDVVRSDHPGRRPAGQRRRRSRTGRRPCSRWSRPSPGRGVSPARCRFRGSTPDGRYRVRVRSEAGAARHGADGAPGVVGRRRRRRHRRERGRPRRGRARAARARPGAGLPAPPGGRRRVTPG